MELDARKKWKKTTPMGGAANAFILYRHVGAAGTPSLLNIQIKVNIKPLGSGTAIVLADLLLKEVPKPVRASAPLTDSEVTFASQLLNPARALGVQTNAIPPPPMMSIQACAMLSWEFQGDDPGSVSPELCTPTNMSLLAPLPLTGVEYFGSESKSIKEVLRKCHIGGDLDAPDSWPVSALASPDWAI